MRVGELVTVLGDSLQDVITALYRLARSDQAQILNPGCDDVELRIAEERIHHPLHPLHRFLLKVSNGGTFPYSTSLVWFAAAVPREYVWRWKQPATTPGAELSAARGQEDTEWPLILGSSLADCFANETVSKLHLDTFAVLASGYDGRFFGYALEDPERIDVVNDVVREVRAPNFETFVSNLSLRQECAMPEFAHRMRAVLGKQ